MEFNRLVSVIMPVHNGERFLGKAIESVLLQTYSNFEFLIIENCSSDTSVDIIKKYNDSRIRLIIEEDCGQVQAYNRGFREAKGEYIFIHDHDDISAHNRIHDQLAFMQKNKIDICGSFVQLVDIEERIVGLQKKSVSNNEIRTDFFYNASAMHNSSVVINRKIFSKIGYWEISFFPIADSEFFYRALSSEIVFGNIPKYLYNYRIHESQITAKPTRKGFVLLGNLQKDYLLKNKNRMKASNYFFYKSLIYYYADSLILSFLSNIISMLKGKIDKQNMRYFTVLLIFGLPLKVFRRYNLLRSQIFINTKAFFDNLFKISV